MAIANRSCGTCRDRRILCDRATPTCLQCIRSRRKCQGYGLRLSWPNAGDSRRAIVGKIPFHAKKPRHFSDAHLVHVSFLDIEMHYYLTSSVPNKFTRPILQIPMLWNPSVLDIKDKYLFQYFQCVASRSLTTFGHDPTNLGNVLVRIALSSNTPSSAAVLRSLLSLSSLHRYGIQMQAVQLKVSALNALAAASKGGIGPMEAIQHVAAGMLLCSFEIHQASCTSEQWTWYICGVKEVIKAAGLSTLHGDSDLAILVDWVYYHDVLARFSLRHWRGDAMPIPPIPRRACAEISLATPSTFAILDLLSEVCNAVSAGPPDMMTSEELDDYKSFLKVLDWRIRNSLGPVTGEDDSGAAKIVELYRLALLVYLHRVSGNLLDQQSGTQQQIDQAFAIFSKLNSCERQFPVFVFGCEARTDDQRAIILELIFRTEKNISSRSLLHVKLLLQAIWAQDDLADQELHYWDKLSCMISLCAIVPTFV
ncbi:fungal-specific transcription factor domain-containing protein [Hypoxylon crocopeplum]|nr:fungal-specific transcription factor domain-containing protein [Hypoxylon crocopeplum]